MKDLEKYSINEIEKLYREGFISEEEAIDYIKKWNKESHFSQAVLKDARIKLFDPEKSGVFYRHLKDKFGLKGV